MKLRNFLQVGVSVIGLSVLPGCAEPVNQDTLKIRDLLGQVVPDYFLSPECVVEADTQNNPEIICSGEKSLEVNSHGEILAITVDSRNQTIGCFYNEEGILTGAGAIDRDGFDPILQFGLIPKDHLISYWGNAFPTEVEAYGENRAQRDCSDTVSEVMDILPASSEKLPLPRQMT